MRYKISSSSSACIITHSTSQPTCGWPWSNGEPLCDECYEQQKKCLTVQVFPLRYLRRKYLDRSRAFITTQEEGKGRMKMESGRGVNNERLGSHRMRDQLVVFLPPHTSANWPIHVLFATVNEAKRCFANLVLLAGNRYQARLNRK
jgi:hypothetical protein